MINKNTFTTFLEDLIGCFGFGSGCFSLMGVDITDDSLWPSFYHHPLGCMPSSAWTLFYEQQSVHIVT